MGVFGPKYPRPLQEVVTHAERFCDLLARLERGAPRMERALAWLTGRAEEIALVYELGIGDWTARRRSLEHVALSLESYLADLHAEARALFFLQGVLECCEDDVFLTAPLSPDAETRLVEPVRGEEGPPHDTWFELGAVVREVYGSEPALGPRPKATR
jgi:hypothetical protein